MCTTVAYSDICEVSARCSGSQQSIVSLMFATAYDLLISRTLSKIPIRNLLCHSFIPLEYIAAQTRWISIADRTQHGGHCLWKYDFFFRRSRKIINYLIIFMHHPMRYIYVYQLIIEHGKIFIGKSERGCLCLCDPLKTIVRRCSSRLSIKWAWLIDSYSALDLSTVPMSENDPLFRVISAA